MIKIVYSPQDPDRARRALQEDTVYSALKGWRRVPEYHGLYIADAWSDQGESISMLGSIQKKVVVMVLEDVGEPKE